MTVLLMRRSFSAAAMALGRRVGDVGLVEEHLPLQIAQLDEITVDDPQSADAGPDQRVGQHGPQRPAAEQDRAARH